MLATLEKVHMQQCRPIADKYIYIFISNYAYVMMVINISVTSIEFFLCTKQDTSRDITLMTKVHIIKAMGFPVVMYGCECWIIEKAERQRIDDFKLWCYRRFLRVSWTARRSNQSILKKINPEYSLEGLMLKLNVKS